MFHLIITIVYLLPNIYLFFRIRKLFISKEYRLRYTIIYLLLASIYPVSQPFSHSTPNEFAHLLVIVANYLLPFYLYVFLQILLYDLFLLINHFTHLVSRQKLRSFRFRQYAFSSIMVLSVLIVAGGIINLNTIRVSRYHISINGKNSRLDHLRVVFVSDIHIGQDTRPQFIRQFAQKTRELQPDLILYGGDIIERDANSSNVNKIENILRELHSTYGAYAVLGNHEFYGGQQDGQFFKKAGITLLNDTMIKIEDSFYLAGRIDQHFRGRKALSEILATLPLNLPVIMMDHRPTHLEEVSEIPVDVKFSGHTHNGQLFPINLIMKSIYELPWGYEKISHTHFFVSSGLRLWGPPVKTAGKSEIMLVDIVLN
jgi:predicted MPP superfamily phosphohydrolase